MTDPYLPSLADFQYSVEEQKAIEEALKTAKPWDWTPTDAATETALKAAKARILAFHLQRHNGNCCYCQTNLAGAGPFMTDREHVLPKGKAAYRSYSYTPWNLAAACKRCNLQFKGAGDSFVVDKTKAASFQDSANYLFVHPNFDDWFAHLTRIAQQVNAQNLVIYKRNPKSAKADYAYSFFDLGGLEIDSFDRAQGAPAQPVSDLANQVRALAETYGQ